MNRSDASRGQPLLVYAAILGVWLIVRVLLWEPISARSAPASSIAKGDGERPVAAVALSSTLDRGANSEAAEEWYLPSSRAVPAVEPAPGSSSLPQVEAQPAWRMQLARRNSGPRDTASPGFAVADRSLLGPGAAIGGSAKGHFSGDAWLLWRDGPTLATAPGIATYGRSQAGAVLRYRLAPDHVLEPTIHVRAVRTIGGPRQTELAAGLSLRPLPGFPVSVAAEARVFETAAGRALRPAAFAVTQLPPAPFPLGLRGEAYLQAGYVGGEFATAFVDGQARVDRRVVRRGEDGEVRIGLAAWGGAQKDAARLDVGPSASLGFKLGEARARVAADYRLRVAGGAAPASGPAVTFSAGF